MSVILLIWRNTVIKEQTLYEFFLDPAGVDACSQKVEAYLTGAGIEKRDILRYTLSVEEILLKSIDNGAAGQNVRLTAGVRLCRPFLTVRIDGEQWNAFEDRIAAGGVLGGDMLRSLGLTPDYDYTKGANLYTFHLKRKSLGSFAQLVLAVLLSLLVGFGGRLLPEAVREGVLLYALRPFHDTFLKVLGCVAGPMIFLAVVWGIYGIGDAAALKRIGKKILGSFVLVDTVAAAAAIGLFLPFLKLNYMSSANGGTEFSAVLNMVLDIIPKDIVSPFVSGNSLQIIFLAAVVGVMLIFLGQKTDKAAVLVGQLNSLAELAVSAISRLIPIFVFSVLVDMIWIGDLAAIRSFGKMLLAFAGEAVLLSVVYLLYTAVKNRVSPFLLFRKGLQTFLIALTTASSSAAYSTCVSTCQQDFGVDDKITSFGIPLGMVTLMPGASVLYVTTALYFAEVYGIQVSVPWFVALLLVSTLLAVATPPIPGGTLSAYAVLFSMLGIPTAGLAVVLACDAILDCVGTGTDMFWLQYSLLNQAKRLDLLDREKLEKK